jgi:hypothetical protein
MRLILLDVLWPRHWIDHVWSVNHLENRKIRIFPGILFLHKNHIQYLVGIKNFWPVNRWEARVSLLSIPFTNFHRQCTVEKKYWKRTTRITTAIKATTLWNLSSFLQQCHPVILATGLFSHFAELNMILSLSLLFQMEHGLIWKGTRIQHIREH